MSSGLQVYVDMAAEALRDGTDLYGQPLPRGAGGLADQGVIVEQLAQKMAADDPVALGYSGVTAQAWREHAASNARAVAAAAAKDRSTAVHLDASGQVVAEGGAAMDSNNQAAADNTAAIAPYTGSPAGDRQMLRELDNRTGTARNLIKASDQRAVMLAQLLRGGPGAAAAMAPAGAGAGMGAGGAPASMGGGGGGFSFPNLSGITKAASGHQNGSASNTSALTRAGGPSVFQNLNERQMNVAKAIVNEGLRLGISPNGIQIALMTALAESGLKSLANSSVPNSLAIPNDGVGHDHDSVGPFQQRQSWGATADLMNPTISANKFYTALLKVHGWERMDLGAAAQAVQRSAFPDAYNKYRAQAGQILRAVTS
ncbi:hypothetical protein [Mycobacteroides abscessus]|uniref:hypothetical protein n=1 Tax=Mycobacteroides abscessus TaxID=36809 RepID=UPI000940CA78|nr:hypothetical protein [Mycobacteroides abscessus]